LIAVAGSIFSSGVCSDIAIRSSSASSTPIEKTVPTKKTVHVILDNYAAHKHPKVIAWLARTRASPSSSRPPAPYG
jgi:hypothetical protein